MSARTASRAASLLIKIGRPLTQAEMAKSLGLKRTSMASVFHYLRKMYGSRFVKDRSGIAVRYSIADTKLVTLEQLPDLWRGWINPATGIVPARLGL